MTRLLVFVLVIMAMVLYLRFVSRPRRFVAPSMKKKPQRSTKPVPSDEFWVQVYDTDSDEEAKKIRIKFRDLGIQCFLYEQGKKDVYGNLMKRYGVSVPKQHAPKAQSVLAQV